MRPRNLAVPLVLPIVLAACTAGAPAGRSDGPKKQEPQTLEIWHGWTADHEVKAFEDAIDAYTKKNPHISVKLVKGVEDDKIIQGIRGGTPPDIAASFTTDNVAQFCKTGMFQDLAPLIKRDKVDVGAFPAAVRSYIRYNGKQCVMPLLADAYGLYYNKKLMKGNEPPKTLSQLAELAKKLTVRKANGDIEVAGFMPTGQYYENSVGHLGMMVGARMYNEDGTSAISSDPAWKELLTWQKDLIDWFGHAKLERFRKGLGQEWSADNPFHEGKVAMALDGEWRNAMIANDAAGLDYGTAPLPVSDDNPELHGSGYISGTIVGVPRGAEHADAAWDLVKYLTTDTGALVTLSNALRNVPTTRAARKSPRLDTDENFQTFLDIFDHPKSGTIPAHINNVFNQEAFQRFVDEKWEPGKAKDLDAGLRGVDETINKRLKLAGE